MKAAPFLTFPRKQGKGSESERLSPPPFTGEDQGGGKLNAMSSHWQEQSVSTAYSLRPTGSPAGQPKVLARAAAAGAVLLALSGCGNIEPWVKPYERQALADPIMSLNANPVSSEYIDHVHDAREGARGATGGGGGGCGCN